MFLADDMSLCVHVPQPNKRPRLLNDSGILNTGFAYIENTIEANTSDQSVRVAQRSPPPSLSSVSQATRASHVIVSLQFHHVRYKDV